MGYMSVKDENFPRAWTFFRGKLRALLKWAVNGPVLPKVRLEMALGSIALVAL